MALLNCCKYLPIILLVCLSSYIFPQSIKINEFMASNSNSIQDPDYNNYGDWIELYNSSNYDFNLYGCYITDEKTDNNKYKFTTNLIIPAKGYLLIWADDHNTGSHTNFKLSASGEFIGLYNSSLNVIDTITFSAQQVDVSYGRYPDGVSMFYLFNPATPLFPNLETSILNRLPDPIFSIESGFYTGRHLLYLSCSKQDADIHYTTDGTIPTINSPRFINAIDIYKTVVIKAAAIKTGYISSKTITKTYILNDSTKLPVISLSTNPDNFFSDTSGIYVAGTNGIISVCYNEPRNWNQDWERPITIELFEKNRERAFCVDAGVKICGGCSRFNDQKSLAFYFRDEYNYKKLHYRLFDDRKILEYNNFILRNGGNDWFLTMFRDAFLQTVASNNTDIDCQAYRPTIMFLNGEYYGIHNLREKLNQHYVEEHHQVNADNVDIIEYNGQIIVNNGDMTTYNNIISFLTNNNLSDSLNYLQAGQMIDINEFIDYQIFEIYSANPDWPYNNTKLWTAHDNSAKWRWMLYDLDLGLGGCVGGNYDYNTLAYASTDDSGWYINPPWSTIFLCKLLKNTDFKNEFIQRFASHLNNTFETNYLNNVIDSLKQLIEDEIPRHKSRWINIAGTMSNWDENINFMRTFVEKRPEYMRTFIKDRFYIEGLLNLTLALNDTKWGTIKIQNIEIKNNYNQLLFKNIPFKVTAVPKPGYKFVRWEGVSTSNNNPLIISLNEDNYLKAIFTPVLQSIKDIVINEINFKSFELFDTGDWIELYNSLDLNIDLCGWQIVDLNNNRFKIPENTIIKSKDYIVICQDSTKFKLLYNDFSKLAGNFIYGLANDKENILLYNNEGQLVDEVCYDKNNNWELSSQLTGRTLSLINPQSDNSKALSWKLSVGYGTPGFVNDIYSKEEETNTELISDFYLYPNYPNPFNPTTTVTYHLPSSAIVNIEVFNVLGESILYFDMGLQDMGKHHYQVNLKDFSSGLYVCSVSFRNINSSQLKIKYNKMLLIK
ncbi:MAG: CotH kinase family protein [bacterium]